MSLFAFNRPPFKFNETSWYILHKALTIIHSESCGSPASFRLVPAHLDENCVCLITPWSGFIKTINKELRQANQTQAVEKRSKPLKRSQNSANLKRIASRWWMRKWIMKKASPAAGLCGWKAARFGAANAGPACKRCTVNHTNLRWPLNQNYLILV